ncbi:Gfo/Idh/MocA family oxidoreductase [Microbacterium sp.]|uniref:Gfo/Idh/MocA family protein n=1 Tax=Microbacterium sp. TaxID=51671 RepID=UPI0028AA20C8|nr:Gfo/Idh/MocA family oxidoreductase [Microbacterium sp.]
MNATSSPAASEATPKEVRYGLVGTGYFGLTLGRGFQRLPGARITRVYDPENAENAVREFGAVSTETVAELCASEDVDAVIVASPNWAHREAVVLAAQAGKPVFCEKPMALSYGDCSAMVEAASAAGVLLMSGHVMNFMNGVRRVKKMVADGMLGDIVYCRAARNGWEEPQPSISWKKRRDLSGGHLYHHIHELDVVQFIMGAPETVTMVGGNVAHRGAEFGDEDDLLLITLEFGGGAFATLEYGSAFRWPEHYLLVQGTLGAARIDLTNGGVIARYSGVEERFLLHRSAEEDAQRAEIYASSSTDGGIMYGNPTSIPPLWLSGIVEEETSYFHGLLTGEVPDPEFAALTDGSAARLSIATADALTLSLRQDRKVRVAEVIVGAEQRRRESDGVLSRERDGAAA